MRLGLDYPEAVGIESYLDADGRITRWPQSKTKRKDRLPILAYFAAHFEGGRTYSEKEINELLKDLQTFGDHVLVRRELVDRGYLKRELDGSHYWKQTS
jgi:hypothetical protein